MKQLFDFGSEAIKEYIDPSGELEVIATGFRFLEGPAWDTRLNRLVFSDIPGNALYSWNESEGVTLIRPNSFLANGNTFDSHGNLITCEHGTSRLTMTTPKGDYLVLADSYRGSDLNSPNDVIATPNGFYIFTDPPYGRYAKTGIPRPQQLEFQGVFKVSDKESEDIELLSDDFDKPNGLCLSLDAEYLYIVDTSRDHIRKFNINDDGTLTGGEVWIEVVRDAPGVFDGIRMSSNGLLWCTGPGGILIYDEQAKLVDRLRIPEIAANLEWGGPQRKDLFITATSSLYLIRG